MKKRFIILSIAVILTVIASIGYGSYYFLSIKPKQIYKQKTAEFDRLSDETKELQEKGLGRQALILFQKQEQIIKSLKRDGYKVPSHKEQPLYVLTASTYLWDIEKPSLKDLKIAEYYANKAIEVDEKDYMGYFILGQIQIEQFLKSTKGNKAKAMAERYYLDDAIGNLKRAEKAEGIKKSQLGGLYDQIARAYSIIAYDVEEPMGVAPKSIYGAQEYEKKAIQYDPKEKRYADSLYGMKEMIDYYKSTGLLK